MSDTVAEVKETTPKVATPEKEVVEKEETPKKETNGVNKETNGDAKKNGVEKVVEEEEAEDEDEDEEKPVENGDSKETENKTPKRKSDVGGDKADDVPDGVSPEKKAKLEEKEKAENGEAEVTA